MSILLGLAEGHAFANDAEIQKSALQVRGPSAAWSSWSTWSTWSSLVQFGPAGPAGPGRPPPVLSSSLQVIINCVCAPDQGLLPGGPLAVAPLGASLQPAAPRVLARVWQLVQNNNGIKVSASGARARASS